MKKLIEHIRAVPHLFAKVTVVYCIMCATAASAYGMWAQAHGASMEGILVAVLGFFGGELLFLCLKTILKKDKEDTDHENPTEQPGI